MGVKAGECYHCHTGRCPVGVATQDPKLRARLNPDDAALRVYNYLHSMTLEAQYKALILINFRNYCRVLMG